MRTLTRLSPMLALAVTLTAGAAELPPAPGVGPVTVFPAATEIVKDHPRLLLRPKETPYAISVGQLKKLPRDAEFDGMLAQLRKCREPATAALAWLLTDDQADAERALAALQNAKVPSSGNNPFDVYFTCRDIALAYDWLHGYPGFTEEIRKAVRDRVFPLAEIGYKRGDDHVFHNYVWMWNGGAALWALASAGDDPRGDKLLASVAARFNASGFPAMSYLQGQPADAPGYWSLYCLTPGVQVLAAAQSAFEQDLAGKVARDGGGWLSNQLENLVHQVLPDMRHMPWGDIQNGGDGGVAQQMAGTIDMMTWLTGSPTGARLSRWLAAKRGPARFFRETAVYYFLYPRHFRADPQEPPLSFLAGGRHGGNWMAREKWDDGATIVAMHCTDTYTGHNHSDQGSFIVYRKGLLAVDAGTYGKVGGPQHKTLHHNTLLFGGASQRGVRPNYNPTVENYVKALSGKGFETGNMLFQTEQGAWAAAAGEFGQAYVSTNVGRIVRQTLFVRPGALAVVDHLEGPAGQDLPEVTWLLNVSAEPQAGAAVLTLSNGKAWLRCRSLLPGGVTPAVTNGPPTYLDGENKKMPTWRAEYRYPGKRSLTLVHLVEVGDGTEPDAAPEAGAEPAADGVVITLAGRKFLCASAPSWAVSERK